MKRLYVLAVLFGAAVIAALHGTTQMVGMVAIPCLVLAYWVGLWLARSEPVGWHGVGHLLAFVTASGLAVVISPRLMDLEAIAYIFLAGVLFAMALVGLIVHRVASARHPTGSQGSRTGYAAALGILGAVAGAYLWWVIKYAGDLAFTVPWVLGSLGIAILVVTWYSRAPSHT